MCAQDVVQEESHPKFLYRVYCGHCYHHGCLETHTKTPPFTGKAPALLHLRLSYSFLLLLGWYYDLQKWPTEPFLEILLGLYSLYNDEDPLIILSLSSPLITLSQPLLD